jgi:hypothetical protein
VVETGEEIVASDLAGNAHASFTSAWPALLIFCCLLHSHLVAIAVYCGLRSATWPKLVEWRRDSELQAA